MTTSQPSAYFFYWGEIHKIKLTILKGTVQWHLVHSHFLSPWKEALYPLSSHSSYPFSPQLLATTNLLSVCMDLPVLDIAYKWGHTICGLLWLSITFLRFIHVVAWISTSFLLKTEQYSIVRIYHLFRIYSSVDGYLGFFSLWLVLNLFDLSEACDIVHLHHQSFVPLPSEMDHSSTSSDFSPHTLSLMGPSNVRVPKSPALVLFFLQSLHSA